MSALLISRPTAGRRRGVAGRLLPLLPLLLALGACHSETTDPDDAPPFQLSAQQLRTMRADTVKEGNVTDALKFNGIVDFNPDKVANIYPLVSGTVQGITAKLGEYVQAGQTLGTIRSTEIATYDNTLAQATAALSVSRKQLQQQKSLYESGLASQVDVTSAQGSYDQAQASLTAAQRILKINGSSSSGQFTVKSPISGFVVQKTVTNGMAIRTDNGAPLFLISDLKNVWVTANVYEENIGQVHKGDSVTVTTITYPGRVFRGRVDELLNVLDPTSKVMKVRVVLANAGYLLKPQMFATVQLNTVEQQRALTIASRDLIFDHSQYYVVVLTGGPHVQLRPVEVISINGPRAYVQSGLKAGERLVGTDALLIYGALNS